MKYDKELKRRVPSTLGELRSYFDDADPQSLGGVAAKANILQTLEVLIDASPGRANAQPSISHTEMVRMLMQKSKEMAAAVKSDSPMSDFQVLVEAAKMTNNPTKMIEVAKRIEEAARSPKLNIIKQAQVRAVAMGLRQFAAKANQ